MTRRIVGFSLQFRLAVLLVAAGVLTFGLVQVRSAPVDVLPEFKAPYVEVQTEALGLSAPEVEQLITSPMEADLLNGVAFLHEIRSESVAGLSSIQLYFEPGTDVLRARQMVQEKLTEARALPNVSRAPVMVQPLSSTGRAVMIGLSSKDMSLIDMSVLARWKIKPKLLGVPGVANVAVFGQRERQIQVQVDPRQLRQRGVTLSQVIETTANSLWVSPLSFVEASTPGTGGFIDTPQQRLGIQHVLPVTTPADLARVSLGGAPGTPATLGDVASVTEDHQPLIGDALNKDGTQLLLVVEKFPGASTLAVTRAVEQAMQTLAPGLTGVQVDTTVYRPAGYIETALDNLGLAVLAGLLLLLVVFMTLLRSWRAALVSLVTVPLSLTAAVVVLHLRGTTFNTLVLLGLVVAVGVVVDDAVVDVDNLARRLFGRHRDEGAVRKPTAVLLEAYSELRSPLVYATLVVLVAAAPLLALGGITGDLIRPLVLSYGLAVLVSMVVVLVVTPALAVLLMWRSPGSRREEPAAARWLQGAYRWALPRFMGRALWAPLLAVVALLLGLAVLPQLGDGPTLPARQDSDLLVRWEAPPGTSLPAMSAATAAAATDLRAVPGVRNVGGHVGRAVTSDKVVGINSGELWLSLDPGADHARTVAAVQRVLDRHPEVGGDVASYPEQRIADLGPQTDEPVVVRVYGEERTVLAAKAEEVRTKLAGTDGVVDATLRMPVEEPTVEVEVDLARAQQFGLKPGDVRRAAATLVAGIQVGSIFEDQKVFDVVVVGRPAVRDSLADVRGLLIDAPDGRQVRLDQVADVRTASFPVVLRHDSVSRYVDVTAGVRGRDVGDVADEVERDLSTLALPVGYHAELLSDQADRRSGTTRVQLLFLAAAIVVFLLLQAAFGSWRLASLLLLTLPVALVGGALAAVAGGGEPARSTLLGLVAVLGIATRNAVVLLARLERLPRGEDGRPVFGLVSRVAEERLVPVVATALATAAMLVPFVVLGDVPGTELVRPLVVTVLGGLVTSLLLTLFVLPSLYLRLAASAGPGTPPGPPAGLGESGQPSQRPLTGREWSDATA
jgi:CzcA family heavy metal efflux pump